MDFETQNGIFNSEGRMMQVEYAQNASTQGSTVILQKHGNKVLIAYENRQSNGLVIPLDKIHTVDKERQIYVVYSGLKPDSLCVMDEAYSICAKYKYTMGEDIPLDALARKIGEFKQEYTVGRRHRPLGLRTVLFSTENSEPRIFIIETDGNYSEYISCCVGYKSEVVTAHLEENNGQGCIFQALLKVLQKDATKVKAYELSVNGLIAIGDDILRAKFGA